MSGEVLRFQRKPMYDVIPPGLSNYDLRHELNDINMILQGTHDGHAFVDTEGIILKIIATPQGIPPKKEDLAAYMDYFMRDGKLPSHLPHPNEKQLEEHKTDILMMFDT